MPSYNNSYSNQPYYGNDYRQPNDFSSYLNNLNNRSQQMVPQNYNTNTPDCRLKGKPVTSIEEARAQSIDLDGTISYFPDITSKKIYTKQFNSDGTSSFKVYTEDTTDQANFKYVTQQELVDVVAGIKAMINSYILALPSPLHGPLIQNGIPDASVINSTKKEELKTPEKSDIVFNI